MKVIWKPWIRETQTVVNRYASYFFAALALSSLLLLNMLLVLTCLSLVRKLVSA